MEMQITRLLFLHYSYTDIPVLRERRNRMNKNTILYLCDGDIPTCRKDECYKRGGEYRHTTDADHALNSESRNLVSDEQGNLWETSPEN